VPLRSAFLVAACVSIAACSSAPRPETAPAAPAAPAGRIQHLIPPDNNTGAAPARFEWTPVAGADSYAITVFNEIDIEVWQQDGMREPRVAWPAELRVDGGTYFWVVAALQGDRVLAQSGRAAFVILR
jgi:hypothetical protein